MQMKPRTANPAQTTPIFGVWKGSYNKIRVEPITGGVGQRRTTATMERTAHLRVSSTGNMKYLRGKPETTQI